MSYREIKFRGKDVFSEKWCYGVYIPAEFTTWREPSISDGYRRKEIDPETIGQYTGHKDVNGIEIYEGDILKIHIEGINGTDETFQSVVKFRMGAWEIDAPEDVSYRFDWMLTKEFIKVKVIGNIFDNPELLEEKK